MFLFLSDMTSQSVIVSQDVLLRSDMRYEVLSMRSGKTLLFRDRAFDQDVMGYDASLKLLWTKELAFEKKRIGIIGLVNGQDDFTIIYQFRERMSIFIVAQKFDDELNLISHDTLIEEKSQLNTPEYYLAKSKDQTKAVVFKTERSETVAAYGIDVEQHAVMWTHLQAIADANVRKDFRQMLVSNSGRGFLVFETDNQWNKRKSHRIEIIPLDSSTATTYIALPGVLCYDINFEFNNGSQSIIGACSYSEKADNKTVGIKTFDVPVGDAFGTNVVTIRFDEGLLEDIYGKKVKKKKGLRDLVIRHIQPRNDGGLVVLGELSKEYSRRPSFATASSSTYSRRWVDYYFEDIVAFSIHPDGSLHWSEVLHKRQYSQDDDAMFSSFFVFELPSQLRILFNDEIRSENTVSEYIVTGKGLRERKNLMSTDYQNLKLRFREAIQTGSKSLIVPSLKSSRLSLVKISYNEM